MRILQINAVYKIGSTGRTCMELQNYINNNTGNECKTAFCYGGNNNDGFIMGSNTDRKIHGLFSRISGKQGYFSSGKTKKLLKYIDGYKPDIIHLRNLHGNYINLPLLFDYLKKNKISVVVTLHDCWFYTGKCMHYTTIGCNKWQNNCGDCPNIKEGNSSWFFDRTKLLLENKKKFFSGVQKVAFVGVSDWITNEIKKSSIGQNADEVIRIYNWVDEAIFKPDENPKLRTEYGLENYFVILGVAGNWDSKKGYDDFLTLNTKLNEKQRIVLLGNINDNADLPDNIINIGQTDSIEKLAQIYKMADVFVTFSKEESFGKVSAEALSCGTPVICYNSTANPELVGDGCGYVADNGDVDAVKRFVDIINENGKKSYSQKCVSFAKKMFNKEKCINQYIELYNKIIAK